LCAKHHKLYLMRKKYLIDKISLKIQDIRLVNKEKTKICVKSERGVSHFPRITKT